MTVEEIIEAVSLKYPHPYTDEDIIKIINRIQKELFRTLFKPETVAIYDIVEGNPWYTLDFSLQNIIEVVVDGVEYEKVNTANGAPDRYYYYADTNTIGIYPTPESDLTGGLTVFHYQEPSKLTIADLESEPEFDSVWHMMIVYRICKELCESARDAEMGNYFVSQANSLEVEYRGSTNLQSYEIQLPGWG